MIDGYMEVTVCVFIQFYKYSAETSGEKFDVFLAFFFSFFLLVLPAAIFFFLKKKFA